jgi:hypothetical protein
MRTRSYAHYQHNKQTENTHQQVPLHTPFVANQINEAPEQQQTQPTDNKSTTHSSTQHEHQQANASPPLVLHQQQSQPTALYEQDDHTIWSDGGGSSGIPPSVPSDHSNNEKCPSVQELTRILIKHARNSRLRNLDYPADLVVRRKRFNNFIDNLTILCSISVWTRTIFKTWPVSINVKHNNVSLTLYNLLFTYSNDACQKHLIDGPIDATIAMKTLQRHCTPLTEDHINKMQDKFRALKQGYNEVATSYFNRIRETKRECYHSGIKTTDHDLLKRALRGASTHNFYDTTYKSYER